MLNASRLPLPAAVAAAVAALLSSSPLSAQQPVPARPAIVLPAPTGAATSVTLIRGAPVVGKQAIEALGATTGEPATLVSSTPQDPAAAAAAASANLRVQKWKQLQWDRRPSSILQAWSLPELKPYDPAEEKDKPKDGAATPTAGAPAPAPAPAAPAGGGEAVEGELSAEEIAAMLAELGGEAPPEMRAELEQALAAARATPAAGAAAAPAAATGAQQLAEKKLQRECEMAQRAVTLGR
jgi:hypothetical protein